MVFKCSRRLAPDYIAKKLKKRSEIHNKVTRNKNKMDIPGYRTAAGQRTFHHRAVSLWNSLPARLTELTNLILSYLILRGNSIVSLFKYKQEHECPRFVVNVKLFL